MQQSPTSFPQKISTAASFFIKAAIMILSFQVATVAVAFFLIFGAFWDDANDE